MCACRRWVTCLIRARWNPTSSSSSTPVKGVFLNKAGYGEPHPAVRAAMADFRAREAEAGGGMADREAMAARSAVVADAAAFIGAPADATTLISTTAATWFACLARLPLGGRSIVLAAHEWGENVRSAKRLAATTGVALRTGPADPSDLDGWRAAIDATTVAISCPVLSSIAGVTPPLAQIARLPRPEDAVFIVDAAQGYGHLPFDFADVGVDLVMGTGRKWLRGPRGIGIAAMSERGQRMTGLSPQMLGPFDLDGAAVAGLQAALRVAAGETRAEGLPGIGVRVRQWADELGLRVWRGSGAGQEDTAITALVIPEARRAAVEAALATRGAILKWVDPAVDEPLSPVPPDGDVLLRLSPHLDSDMDVVKDVVEAVAVAAR